jgi:hypothetical protein
MSHRGALRAVPRYRGLEDIARAFLFVPYLALFLEDTQGARTAE